MKCVTWNIRGLRDDRRRGIVGRYLREWGASVVCLQETMLATCEDRIWKSVGRGQLDGYVAINAIGRSGGVIIAWNETLFAKVEEWKGAHVVATKLARLTDGWEWMVASVYGPTIPTRREELWGELASIANRYRGTPMLFGGDFNVTLEAMDRPDGTGGRDPGSEQFWAFLAEEGLMEMGPADCRYTWRSSASPTSCSRLDRFIASAELLEEFPLATVRALPRPCSDHTPIVWQAGESDYKASYLKFDRSWLKEPGFRDDVIKWWTSPSSAQNFVPDIVSKLAVLRSSLLGARKKIRADRARRRDTALRCLQTLDRLEGSRPLSSEEAAQRRAHRNIITAEDMKTEMDWRLRSRQLWLQAGDANTKFFHMAANGRRRVNKIHKLKVGDETLSGQAEIGAALARHFYEISRRGPRNKWRWSGEDAQCIPPDRRAELVDPFTTEEVQKAIAGLNAEGAPGPDGIPVFFYTEFWGTVGPDVMETLDRFHRGVCNMDRLNRSYVVLIPKINGAAEVRDFRPISLSNSIYLIIAKVLANRLRRFMDNLISPFQSAFIPGRQMTDSAVIAGEVIAAWQRNATEGFLWKVDFAKAYDTLDWRFLWVVLRRRGFPPIWIKWMKLCVKTHSFAILVEGQPVGGWISPQRGVRQGCPLAPLLFILAADVLAICTNRVCARGLLRGFQTPSCQQGIPLLQYADDTMFLMEGSSAAAAKVSMLMEIFSDLSGLKLNRAKSSVIGFGMSTEELACCSQALSTPTKTLPIQYLGLPLTSGRLSAREWQPVFEKIERRLEGWKSHMLSRGGRLVLVKSVLSAIPTYYMSIFRMPTRVRSRLDALMRRFFWRGPCCEDARGAALVAWTTICTPHREGGLGVRSLHEANVALLMKWVQRMMKPPSDLATQVLSDVYGASMDWEQRGAAARGASVFWKGLGPVFRQAKAFFRPQLGDGSRFRFWLDEWSGHGPLKNMFPRLCALARDKSVTVEHCWNGAWLPPLDGRLSDQRISELLELLSTLASVRPLEGSYDAWVWRGSGFSVKSAYKLLRQGSAQADPDLAAGCRLLWRRRIPLTVKIFAWQLLRRRLMTRSVRQGIHPEEDATCVLCEGGREDCSHLFFECPVAREVWTAEGCARVDPSSETTFWTSLRAGTYRGEAEWQKLFAILWAIWIHRNDVVFRGLSPSAMAIQYGVRGLTRLWHHGL